MHRAIAQAARCMLMSKTFPGAVQDSLRAQAVAMAKDADVVIFIGGLNKNHQQDCEAGDRQGIRSAIRTASAHKGTQRRQSRPRGSAPLRQRR